MTEHLTAHELMRWRLRRQRLTEPRAGTALDVVTGLTCVQAENPRQAAWAVACRTTHRRSTDLAALLDTGRVIRTHVLRPTWHWVAAEDLAWLVELTGPRVRRTVTSKQLRQVHGLDDRGIERAHAEVLDILAERGATTRGQLTELLRERRVGPPVSSPFGHFVMLLLADIELTASICSGPLRDGEHTYTLTAGRIAPTVPKERDEALGELARRYMVGHGPATERDMAYWATLTLGEVRRGLAVAGDTLTTVACDGRTFWHAADDAPPARASARPRAHLLQILDEIYRGYQDSRWLIDNAGIVPRSRETSTGMALFDSQIVAAVTRTIAASTATFALRPYRTLRPVEQSALRKAAIEYGRFLGVDANIAIEPS